MPGPGPNLNRYQIGTMYGGGLLNGQPFYTQPHGPFTHVHPHQKNAEQWPEYPIKGLVIQEYCPWWSPGCGHSIKEWKVIREFDYYWRPHDHGHDHGHDDHRGGDPYDDHRHDGHDGHDHDGHHPQPNGYGHPDDDDNGSVALICCVVCGYVQAVYHPFDAWLRPIEHAIIVA